MKRSAPEPPRPAAEEPPADEKLESFETAFERLFEKDFTRLYRYLDRLSGDPGLADDLAQESFVRLYRRGSLPESPSTWLVSVARNLLRDERRGAARRLELLELCGSTGDLHQQVTSPETHLLAQETSAQVRRTLASISSRDRQMLLLRHEGYSYREIAETLELSPASIGTMLVRATEAFRKAFKERFRAP
ncbi:MAG TPA: sigma-70 family RNA polymerase sigma factor [Gemmatimonadales bacterium]